MKLYEICFSPTGGTQKAADILSKGIADEIHTVDLTDHSTDFSAISLAGEDMAVIAVPSYGGRVPAPAIDRLKSIKGNGALAVLVCVYGNRAYEDTLIELLDAANDAGFTVISAVAAIAEHSIARQFAAGRPDEADRKILAEYAGKIREKNHLRKYFSAFCPRQPPLQERRRFRNGSKAHKRLHTMRSVR